MKRCKLSVSLALVLLSSLTVYGGFIIQETDPGLIEINTCTPSQYTTTTTNGLEIETRNLGFTGLGYINTDNADGMYVVWQYDAPAAGDYEIRVRYALGGDPRNGEVFINDSTASAGIVALTDTGGWRDDPDNGIYVWQLSGTLTVTLNEGVNTIQMNGVSGSGLANIDYFEVVPEPATMALLGLGSLMAIRRKRG